MAKITNKEFEERRQRLKQLFIFTDKFTVNQSNFKGVKVGKQYILEGERYEVVAISKNKYLKLEYVFLNKTKNILPF